jgi:hypothetical protein
VVWGGPPAPGGGLVGRGPATALADLAPLAPTPTLPQRGREQLRLPVHRLLMARGAMEN